MSALALVHTALAAIKAGQFVRAAKYLRRAAAELEAWV